VLARVVVDSEVVSINPLASKVSTKFNSGVAMSISILDGGPGILSTPLSYSGKIAPCPVNR